VDINILQTYLKELYVTVGCSNWIRKDKKFCESQTL
jgi:hypothetical protein